MGGLARDGGLYVPADIPDVRGELERWAELSYVELAAEVIQPFTDLDMATVRSLTETAYAGFRHPQTTPVVKVGDLNILELFHGPTLAFKDLALQFLGGLFSHYLAASDEELNLVVATSGDTGSAAIYGVRGRDRIRIFVMHPNGRISESQERQMTAVLDDNVFNVAVEGTFDDCQAIAKDIFNDLPFRDRYALGSVNSINWARVVAQIVYYFYAALRVMRTEAASEVMFAVPTGNFGDIFAGWIAERMGLPVRRLVLATNENDILARFFAKGEYRMGRVQKTVSPSMDIQVASNFERYLYYRSGANAGQVRDWMQALKDEGAISVEHDGARPVDALFRAGSGTTERTLEIIREFHELHGYLLDPHTAVGVDVARGLREEGIPMICLATAHPAKFSETIRMAVGEAIAHHPVLDALAKAQTHKDVLPADAGAVADFIAEKLDARRL